MNNKLTAAKRKQSGSTLMEVLIALLVFSIGLQGIASLQYQAVKDNFDSTQRSLGVWSAQDLLNRMKANKTALQNNNYAFDGDPCGVIPATTCIDVVCTSPEMATFDLWDALCPTPDQSHLQNQSQLLNINLQISCADSDAVDALACSTGSDFTFDMQWQSKSVTDDTENISDNDDALKTQSFRQVFRP